MLNGGKRPAHATRWLWLIVLLFGLLAGAWAQNLEIAAYNDENVNGVRDLGERGLPGMEFIVAGADYYGPAVTGEDGVARLSIQGEGPYIVLAPSGGRYEIAYGETFGSQLVQINPGNVTRANFGFHEKCVKIKVHKILWNLGPNGLPNGTATIQFEITNLNTWPIGWIFFDLPPGVTVAQNPMQLGTPIPPGGTQIVSVVATGLQPDSETCFTLTVHSPDLAVCCAERICFKVPECDCYQELESIVTCNPDGTYSANLVLQNLTPFQITQVWAVGLNGVTVTPTVTPTNMGPGGTVSLSLTISGQNIDGQMVYVNIMFYNGGTQCCVKPICIQLPNCLECDDRAAVCYARRPVYAAFDGAGGASYNGGEWAQLNGKSVAALSCYASFTDDNPNTAMPDDVVFGYMNLDRYQCFPPVLGTDWALNPRGFHNGLDTNRPNVPLDARWTKRYMGNVFAITFDDEGNAYVAQTSAYNADYAPLIQDFNAPGTPGRNHVPSPNEVADRRLHGRIFKIDNITGKVTIFNEDTGVGFANWNGLPSGPDPAIVSYGNHNPSLRPEIELSGQNFPEVGDVTFDYDNRQIFATSMDDGRIYRFSMSGQKLSFFDPFAADSGAPYGDGFARWGEAIWAAKYHRGRVYFSRWNEDFSFFDQPNLTQNEVYSVAIDQTSGDFVPGSLRHELSTPNNGAITATAPISDISFMNVSNTTGGVRAHMLLAERGMGSYWINSGLPSGGLAVYEQMWWHAQPVNPAVPVDAFTNTYPHRSRGLEYACNPDTRQWAEVSNPVGGPLHINLGSSSGTNSAGGVDFDFIDRGCQGANLGNRNWWTSDYMQGANWYGIQGVPLAGGGVGNSIVIDANGLPGGVDKTTVADVELPCTTGDGMFGAVNLHHFIRSPEGRLVTATIRVGSSNVVAYGVLDANGNASIDIDLPVGDYDMLLMVGGHLSAYTVGTVMDNGGMFATITPIPGDVNCDEEVGPGDFSAMADAFLSQVGDPNYVLFADVDNDGEVGPGDFALLAENFGRSGDVLP